MTTINTLVASAGTALLALGIQSLQTNVVNGCAEIALGILCYAVYELIPPTQK